MTEVAVSAVIPAPNVGRFIAATLESLRARGGGDLEAIVIGDGSTDETAAIARRVPSLDRIAARPELVRRHRRRLHRLVRDRLIEIFWSGVRSEHRFGSRPRALAIALPGLALYRDGVARPDLALRFLKTLGR